MGERGHVRPLLTLTLTVMLVFGFGYYLISYENAEDQSIDESARGERDLYEKIPETIEETEKMMEELTSSNELSEDQEAEIKKNLKVPFSGFIENVGQKSNERIKYYYATDESSIGFEVSKVRIVQQISDKSDNDIFGIEAFNFDKPIINFDLTFVGSNVIEPQPKFALGHSTNYFIGTSEFTGINSYNEIWYYNLYDNIDLRYYVNDQGLKYEFIVNPGGDPNVIAIQISDTVQLSVGDNKVSIFSKTGNLEIIADADLFVYYKENQIPLPSVFKLINDQNRVYGFDISNYDTSKVLVIDPLLLGFSTYIGGSGDDIVNAITIGYDDNIYITGSTESATFPTTLGAIDRTYNGGWDVYIIKLNRSGGLISSTFLGGGAFDIGIDIVVSGSFAFITGYTNSSNFPTTSTAMDKTYNGGWDVFISTIFTSTFSLVHSTYLGGSGDDIATDTFHSMDGKLYITGYTKSANFPTDFFRGYDKIYNGGWDVFAGEFSDDQWGSGTFLGGSGDDFGLGITVDYLDEIYITGYTNSSNFPTTSGAVDEIYNGGWDVFVSRLQDTLTYNLQYSSFLGGSGDDYGLNIAFNPWIGSNNFIISGYTNSSNFPTISGAIDNSYNGKRDIFVSTLEASTGGLLTSSTFLGGTEDDILSDSYYGPSGDIYLIGYTNSSNFPTTSEAIDSSYNGNWDVFVSKFNYTVEALEYSTFFGGSDDEIGGSIFVDNEENIYITGFTNSTNFPTTSGANNETHNGLTDIFISKLKFPTYSTFLGSSSADYGRSITVEGQYIFITGNTISVDFPTTAGAIDNNWNSNVDVFVTKLTGFGNELIFSTFIGGSEDDYVNAIDTSGYIYITGKTKSPNFPTNAIDMSLDGIWDAFVTKIHWNGDSLVTSSYLGGTGDDIAQNMFLQGSNLYITGYTSSGNFPTTSGALNETHNGGVWDIFVTKYHYTGDSVEYSTFLGGSGDDFGQSLVISTIRGFGSDVIITGNTYSADFPVSSGALYKTYNGGGDVFVTQLNSTLNGLIYSTFLGGSDTELGNDIDVERYTGNVILIGNTLSIDFPTTSGTLNETSNGGWDVFVAKLNKTGNGLIFSTLLGGVGNDFGKSISFDKSGNTIFIGNTTSFDFPTTAFAHDVTFNGSSDAFVTKLNKMGSELIFSTFLGGNEEENGESIYLDKNDNVYITGGTQSSDFPTNVLAYDLKYNGDWDVFIAKLNETGKINGLDITNPSIIGPSDLIHKTGNNVVITWNAEDEYPDIYNITINDENIVENETWVSGSISSPAGLLNGKSDGIYTLVISISDKHGHITNDTVVIIIDGTDPIFEPELPTDLYYQNGTIGNTLSWNINDTNPDSFNIKRDSIIINSSNWIMNQTIQINVDSLSEGMHTIVITIADDAGNIATHSVKVTVHSVIPVLNDPNDLFLKDPTNEFISWLINSQYPDHFNITRDGPGGKVTVHSEPDWANSGTFGVNIDGLSEGSYTYVITIVDQAGNFNNDSVLVIIDSILPSIPVSHPDVEYPEFTHGHTITWNLYDTNPKDYIVTLNESEYLTSPSWNNGELLVNIDGLSVGTYNFTLTISDITGNQKSDTVIVVVTDETLPDLDSPKDFTYSEFTSENTLTWIIGDKYPGVYSVTQNEKIFETTTIWTNGSININIDGFAVGNYEITITVYDEYGNSISDTVIVSVTDDTLPDVSDQEDLSYSEGTSDNSITWILGDKYPGVYNITQNGIVFEQTTTWSNGSITIDIDGFGIGSYKFIIYVFDKYDNSRSDTVMVTVTDDKNPTFTYEGIEANEEVKGAIIIKATPLDENGIRSVEFFIDDIDACIDAVCTENNGIYKIELDTNNLLEGTHTLEISVTDNTGNVESETINFLVQNKVNDDGVNIPPAVSIGIIALSGLGVSGGILRIRQRRKMDKAFDKLQTDFEGSEITGEGKSE